MRNGLDIPGLHMNKPRHRKVTVPSPQSCPDPNPQYAAQVPALTFSVLLKPFPALLSPSLPVLKRDFVVICLPHIYAPRTLGPSYGVHCRWQSTASH